MGNRSPAPSRADQQPPVPPPEWREAGMFSDFSQAPMSWKAVGVWALSLIPIWSAFMSADGYRRKWAAEQHIRDMQAFARQEVQDIIDSGREAGRTTTEIYQFLLNAWKEKYLALEARLQERETQLRETGGKLQTAQEDLLTAQQDLQQLRADYQTLAAQHQQALAANARLTAQVNGLRDEVQDMNTNVEKKMNALREQNQQILQILLRGEKPNPR